MIGRKKIGALAFAFILATGFLNLDAMVGVHPTQLQKPFPQKPVSKPLPKQAPKNVAGQVVQNKGLWESIKEKGLQEGVKSWWDRSQAVESAKKEQAHTLLERNKVALLAKHEIEKKLEQETDPSKMAWFRSQLETIKQFIVDNKKALGALGALAVAAGTAVYFAGAKGEKSAEGSAGQGRVLEQTASVSDRIAPEARGELPQIVGLTAEETPTSSLPSLLSTNQSPTSTSSLASTNVQEKSRSKSWTRSLFAPPVLGQRFPSEGQQQTNWGGELSKVKPQSLAEQIRLAEQAEQQQREEVAMQIWLAGEEGLQHQVEQQRQAEQARAEQEQKRLAEQLQQAEQERLAEQKRQAEQQEQERLAKEEWQAEKKLQAEREQLAKEQRIIESQRQKEKTRQDLERLLFLQKNIEPSNAFREKVKTWPQEDQRLFWNQRSQFIDQMQGRRQEPEDLMAALKKNPALRASILGKLTD